MSIRFYDFGSDPKPEKTFGTAAEVLAFIEQFQEPLSSELRPDNGFVLPIGLDGNLALAQFLNASGDPPYLTALTPTKVAETGKPSPFIEWEAT